MPDEKFAQATMRRPIVQTHMVERRITCRRVQRLRALRTYLDEIERRCGRIRQKSRRALTVDVALVVELEAVRVVCFRKQGEVQIERLGANDDRSKPHDVFQAKLAVGGNRMGCHDT
ncbi:hypothetical protein DYGSA30_32820 [Dyella sp. GSA-30]|nr:hypothetical protein DYGSA30_32820 [Dyella sp. GSA-30]